MATIKLSTTKSCARAINYAQNRAVEKSSTNCEIENAKNEMQTIRQIYNKDTNIQAHLCIQSFSPEESQKLGTTEINKMGLELAEKIAPDHQVAVYTHADKEHVHNHIVINSVNIEDGSKLQLHGLDAIEKVRGLNDEIALSRELDIVQKQSIEKKTMAEIQLERKQEPVFKTQIRNIIDETMRDSSITSYEQFREVLESKGVNVQERGKNVTYELLDGNKKVRGNKLGKDYEKDVINNELVNRNDKKQEQSIDRYNKFSEITNGQSETRNNGSSSRTNNRENKLSISDAKRTDDFNQQQIEQERAIEREAKREMQRARERVRDIEISL